MRQQNAGFTLIEMMITLAILGIIVAIAVPSYRQYLVRSNRAAVQTEMMQVAAAMERYKTQQLSYKGADMTALQRSGSYPATGKRMYLFNLQVATNGVSWVLLATPENTQMGDGALKIDNTGRRCWKQNDQNTCDLSDPAQAWSTR